MEKKNEYYYLGANHTVDLIVVAPTENQEVLMIVRGDKATACPNMMAFPGGFVDTDAKKGEYWKDGKETHKDAALRELKEETGLEILDSSRLVRVGVFEGNGRDPRDNDLAWSRSEAFVYMLFKEEYLKMKGKEVGLDDAKAALWVPFNELKNNKLAFDHNQILMKVEGLIRGENFLASRVKSKNKI